MATREEMEQLQLALKWADKPKNTRKTTADDRYSREGRRAHEKEKKGKK
jgi:hypothetical protein